MTIKRLIDSFPTSARALRNTRSLAICAMLLAVQVLLGLVAAIPVGSYLRISFGYLALAAAGALFGPVPCMVNGALADLIGFIIRPTGPYFPGFTLTAMLTGLIYGLMFYRQEPVRLTRIIITQLIVNMALNMLLNSIWLKMLYGQAFLADLSVRILKNAVQLPVDVVMLCALMKLLPRLKRAASIQ